MEGRVQVNEKSSAAEGKMAPKDENEVVRQQHPLVVHSRPPKPIVVEAQNFQTLVQRLTDGRHKRKAVTFAEDVEDVEATEESAASQQPPAKVQAQSLLDYLDRLDQECRPLSRASANRGFFATAGLVKGVRIEEGLQQDDCPLNSPAIDLAAPDDIRLFGKVLTPLSTVPLSAVGDINLAWTGCLSPRTRQVVGHARRTATWAASGDLSGPGPWNLSLEKLADRDRDSTEDDEQGFVDVLYYKGEITFAGHP